MIEVKAASKSFGRVCALRGVSLSVRPGERVAFVGANGSGKTTLLRAIAGLIRIDGQVLVRGIDVSTHPELALRSVAHIPQIAPPIDAPVAEVVRACSRLRGLPDGAVAARALRLGVDIGEVARTRFRDLSGGMKQKILAALALATEAPVLLCDEPTANLDPGAREAFFAQIDERPADSVLVLCSHRPEEIAQLVDRVVEMRDGNVLRDCPPAALWAHPPARWRPTPTVAP
jgi:ABC-2 type transport system ATP-binding protein